MPKKNTTAAATDETVDLGKLQRELEASTVNLLVAQRTKYESDKALLQAEAIKHRCEAAFATGVDQVQAMSSNLIALRG